MPEFKTNWVKTNFINPEDFNRIVSNLNEVRGFANPLTISLVNFNTILTTNESIVAIAKQYNRIAINSGINFGIISDDRDNFFNYYELNLIERISKEIYTREQTVAYCGQGIFCGCINSGGGYLDG